MGIGTRVLKQAANEANPNKLPQVFRDRAGDLMAGSLRYFRGAVASDILTLPDGAKAAALANGFRVAATTTGAINVVGEEEALTAGDARITPDGNIEFFTTDAATEAEVWYFAYGMDPITVDIVVDPATGLGALNPYEGVRLLAANALTGTVTGVAAIVARDDAQPLTAECRLNDDGANVEFLIADAVESARLTFIARPGFGPQADTVAAQMAAPVTAL
jgi:hypothetical protein